MSTNISRIKLPNSTVYNLRDADAQTRLSNIESMLSTALIFKGTASQASDITSLTNYKTGWCYKAIANFTIENVGKVENGDMIIAVADYVSSYKASDWTVVQNNIDDMIGATDVSDGAKGLVPTPHVGDNTKFLKGDGTWDTISVDVPDMTGATASAAGTHGLVPAPQAGQNNKYLKGDGTWGDVQVEGYAPLNSPNFIGNPTTPTKSVVDYDPTTQSNIIASLGYVWGAISANGGATLYNQLMISVADWVADSTYAGFPYKATVPIEGIAPSTFGWIVFNNDAFAATCKTNPETDLGCVYIYTTTLPSANQYFNFWSIATTNEMGAAIAVYQPPTKLIYDVGDYVDVTGMVIHYIAADGTEREMVRSEWQYNPLTPLTAESKYITIAAVDPDIAATTMQRIYVVVGNSLITATNRDTAGYDTSPNLNLVISNVVANDGEYYYVVGIDHNAYENCSNILTVNMPTVVLSVGDYAFKNCTGMTTANYPVGTAINTIGEGVFNGCSSLTTINNITITGVEDYGFAGCSSLTSLDMSNITALGAHALEGTGFSSMEFPSVITTAQPYVMAGMPNLTTLRIRETTKTISANAFANNTSLTSVYISKDGDLSMDATAFAGCTQSTLDIYVAWREGEVANAPWGATNATIHYEHYNYPSDTNYPGESNFPIDM